MNIPFRRPPTPLPGRRPAHPMLSGLRRGGWATVKAAYRLARWLTRFGWAHRRMLAPVYVASTLQILGWALHAAGPQKGLTTALVLMAPVGVWVAWRMHRDRWLRRLHLRIDVPDQSRLVTVLQRLVPGSGKSWRPFGRAVLWAWVAYGYATAWLCLAAVFGAGPPLSPGALWLSAFWILGWAWWGHYRVRVVADMPVDEVRRVWDEIVAKQGGAIPGSTLDPVVRPIVIDGEIVGRTVEGDLPADGRQTCGDVVRFAPRVALAYRTRLASVAIEPTDSDEAHRFAVSWFDRDPLETSVIWAGPEATFDPETGLARVGRHRDTAPITYEFYRRGWGPVHDFIFGTTGAGKSEFLNILLAIERSTPLMASFVIDPQEGQSLPEWTRATHGYARGVEQGLTLLSAMKAEMFARNKYLADVEWVDEKGRERQGVGEFDPLRHTGEGSDRIGDLVLPMMSLTIDEAPDLLRHDQAVKDCEQIGTMIRKCGGKLRMVSQGAMLDQLRSRIIRKMVISGNVFGFRTDDALDGGVTFGRKFSADPSMIPSRFPGSGAKTAGMVYALSLSANARAGRTDYAEDAYGYATAGELTPFTALSDELKAWMADAPGARTGIRPATPIGDAPSLRPGSPEATVEERALAALRRLGGKASTGQIAAEANAKLPSVSGALNAAAKREGAPVSSVGYGVWALAREEATA